MFDESAPCYALLSSTPDNSNLTITKNEANELKMIEEEGFGALEESSISFQLSDLNEELSGEDQQNEEPTSSDDSAVHSPLKELTRRSTPKEKGKMKMSEYDIESNTSD